MLHEQVLILARLINVSADFRHEVQEHFRLCKAMDVTSMAGSSQVVEKLRR